MACNLELLQAELARWVVPHSHICVGRSIGTDTTLSCLFSSSQRNNRRKKTAVHLKNPPGHVAIRKDVTLTLDRDLAPLDRLIQLCILG